MLAVLPCLQELRVLQLSPGLLPAPHAPPEQYAALTSSQHLTFLSLYHCQLPAGAAGGFCPSVKVSRCIQNEGHSVCLALGRVLAVPRLVFHPNHLKCPLNDSLSVIPVNSMPPAPPSSNTSEQLACTECHRLQVYQMHVCISLYAGAMFPTSRSLPGLKAIRMPQPPAGQRPCSAQVLNTPSPFLSSGAAAVLRAARETAGSSSGTSGNGRLEAPFGPGSLEGLAACCPNVAQLWLTSAVDVDADLSPLLSLSGLTELQLGGAVVDDVLAEGVLCGLSQLQRLDLVQCPRFTDAGLVHLTALTALTSLQVSG